MPKSRNRPSKRQRPPTPPTTHIPADQNGYVVANDHAGPADIDNEIRKALADTAARGRLLLTQDPTLETITHRRRANRDIDGFDPDEWWPVALVEPLNYRAFQFSGAQYLLTMAIASKLGLAKAQPGTPPPSVANWTFRHGSRCELLDPTGTVLAEFRQTADPEWRTTALARCQAIVLYGGQLGVRKPAAISVIEYDDRARDAELHAAVAAGAVLAGIVNYIPTAD